MKGMFADERCGAAVLLLGGLVLVFFLAGCVKQEDSVVYTGAIIDVTLVPQSGDLQEGLPTLEDELEGSDDSGTPILAGPPGVSPPQPIAPPDNGGGTSPQATPTPTPTPAPGATPTPAPTPIPTPKAEGPKDCVRHDEAQACADLFGVEMRKIRVVHSTQNIQLSSDAPFALKVTGNKPVVTLNIRGAIDSFPGVCLFVMGHEAKVMVRVGVPMEAALVKGRGDESFTQMQFDPAGSLLRSFFADLAGNQAKLVVTGSGKHVCPVTSLGGNSPSVSCTPN